MRSFVLVGAFIASLAMAAPAASVLDARQDYCSLPNSCNDAGDLCVLVCCSTNPDADTSGCDCYAATPFGC
jgi:hypothetical protein